MSIAKPPPAWTDTANPPYSLVMQLKALIPATSGAMALLLAFTAAAESTIRLGLASLPNGNGNPFDSSARTTWYTFRAFFDALAQLGDNLQIEPALAVAWDNTDDFTWIVTLRDGVTFSNGEPLDAEAALFSYRYLQTDAGALESLSRDVADIVAMEALDERTIKFVTGIPMPEFPRLLAVVPIVPPRYWEDVGLEGFIFEPVGTGPFRVTDWRPARIKLEAFRESWRAPKADKLEILAIPETAARVAGLLTDRIDIASEIGPDDAYQVEAAGMVVYQRPATAIEVIAFNTLIDSPLKDARVRQALNYAIDKEVIVAAIMDGRTRVADQMTPAINPERVPDLAPYSYDPDKAKALLADAGYPDGFSFVFEFSFGTGGTHMPSMFQQVAADLKKIGVDMEVRPLPWSQYVRGVLQGEWGGQAFGFEYEVLPTGSSMRPFRLHSCAWPYPWYCDETIEPAIAQAKQEMEPQARLAAVHEVLRHYHDEAVALLLIENLGIDGVSPRVEGYSQVNGIIPFHEITVGD
jgi:peptide/nickel transport system substrate-binding protein